MIVAYNDSVISPFRVQHAIRKDEMNPKWVGNAPYYNLTDYDIRLIPNPSVSLQDRGHIVMVIRPGGISFDITAVQNFPTETQNHVKQSLFGVTLKRRSSSWGIFVTSSMQKFFS